MFCNPNKHWNKFHCRHCTYGKMLVEEKNVQINELDSMNKRIRQQHEFLVRLHKLSGFSCPIIDSSLQHTGGSRFLMKCYF